MITLIEAAKQALEALEECAEIIDGEWGSCRTFAEMDETNSLPKTVRGPITALRTAIEAAEKQECRDHAAAIENRPYDTSPATDHWIEGWQACAALEQGEKQEPVAWVPIEQPYMGGQTIDILMGDGSILCNVLPQFDGDLWWEGSGTGEKFIDPKYANVTHWRVHSDTTPPAAQRQPLTDEQIKAVVNSTVEGVTVSESVLFRSVARAIEAAHGITKQISEE